MIWAILADVHGNVAALTRVLADSRSMGAGQILDLGDLNSTAGMDLLDAAGAGHVFGNWEASGWPGLPEPYRSRVATWPAQVRNGGFWAAHASPVWPESLALTEVMSFRQQHGRRWGEMFPFLDRDPAPRQAAAAVLATASVRLFLHGHTHLQQAWHVRPDGGETMTAPLPDGGPGTAAVLQTPTDGCLLVGVGSVGSPEDGPGACYALYDDAAGQVTWRRV